MTTTNQTIAPINTPIWYTVSNIHRYTFVNGQALKILYNGETYEVTYEKHNSRMITKVDKDGDKYEDVELIDIVCMGGVNKIPCKFIADMITVLWVEEQYRQLYSDSDNYPGLFKLDYFTPKLAYKNLLKGQEISLMYHTSTTKIRFVKVVSSNYYQLHAMEGNYPRTFIWEKVLGFDTKLKDGKTLSYCNNKYLGLLETINLSFDKKDMEIQVNNHIQSQISESEPKSNDTKIPDADWSSINNHMYRIDNILYPLNKNENGNNKKPNDNVISDNQKLLVCKDDWDSLTEHIVDIHYKINKNKGNLTNIACCDNHHQPIQQPNNANSNSDEWAESVTIYKTHWDQLNEHVTILDHHLYMVNDMLRNMYVKVHATPYEDRPNNIDYAHSPDREYECDGCLNNISDHRVHKTSGGCMEE